MNALPIRILIVDDHPLIRSGLARAIGVDPELDVVAEAASGHEGLELFKQLRPDVTVMDLALPDMDGADAIALIREADPQAKIVILTMHDSENHIWRGLRAGAMSYLLKIEPISEVVTAIRAAHAGQSRIQASVAQKLVNRISQEELSERELEVLRLVAVGKNTKEVAEKLNLSQSTVKFRLRTAFEKLGVDDRINAVIEARRRGLLPADP